MIDKKIKFIEQYPKLGGEICHAFNLQRAKSREQCVIIYMEIHFITNLFPLKGDVKGCQVKLFLLHLASDLTGKREELNIEMYQKSKCIYQDFELARHQCDCKHKE